MSTALLTPSLAPSKVGLKPGGTHFHNEYFAPQPGPCPCGSGHHDVWGWYEKLDDERTSLVKTFCPCCVRAEVLEPIVDHVGDCHCEKVNYVLLPMVLKDGPEPPPVREIEQNPRPIVLPVADNIPSWLTRPEDVDINPQQYEERVTELFGPNFSNACYDHDQANCYHFRVANRAQKEEILRTGRFS